MPTYNVSESRIHVLGRYEKKDGAFLFDNVASGVEFSFRGTSLSLICKTLPRPRINKNYPMFTILSVMIDGKEPCRLMAEIHNEDFEEIKVAEGLEEKDHHVLVMKTDDPLISTFALKGVGAEELLPFENHQKKLLVYGDSITAGGDNAIIAGPSLDVVPGTGIGTYTYATLFSFLSDMEISVLAQCGMPLANFTECPDAINMLEIYEDVSPQNKAKWDMGRFVPDLIMINLGTNDELGKFFDYGKFVEVYEGFIRKIDAYYPNKPYLLVCGQMNKKPALVEAVFKVAEDMSKEGIKTLAYQSKKARRGHPNVFEHKELAEELYAFAKKNALI